MPQRRFITDEVSRNKGIFMISVAAELAQMHPQTLRVYEMRGLIEPQRSAKGTRLYSQADIERLRYIQELTAELGLNLAGVERVLNLEQQQRAAAKRLEQLKRKELELELELLALRRELERSSKEAKRLSASVGGSLVPYRRASHEVVIFRQGS